MNRDLVWRFMDVQTRMIAPICPHYAEYVWRELLKKDGFVAEYVEVLIGSMIELYNKQKANLTNKKVIGFIYVKEQFDEWKVECLRILQNNFNRETCCFAADSVILEALQSSSLNHGKDFRQTQKVCLS